MASAASRASGQPADTFNAAGLNSGTVAKYGGTVHNSDVTAYRVSGEILGDLTGHRAGRFAGGHTINAQSRNAPTARGLFSVAQAPTASS